jgi:hypothetical protein
MDDLKKPTSLLAGSNIIFSVGGFVYLYKKLEQLQNENIEMKRDLLELTNKLQKNNNEDLQTEEFLQTIKKDVKLLKKNNKYEEDLNAVVSALEECDINVKLPSQNKKIKKNKKYKFSSSEDESEESEEKVKPKHKKYGKKDKEELDDKDVINMLKKK